ncbi:MAG: hypothetical protein K2Q01_02635 [Rickettsiales bacterium]|nr:hypothetical protein [Rickettsiales bacterium]
MPTPVKPAGNQVVRVVAGINQGRPAWWVIRMSKTSWERYRKDIKSPRIDFTQYGEILESGWGAFPPEEVVAMLEAEHGIKLQKPSHPQSN